MTMDTPYAAEDAAPTDNPQDADADDTGELTDEELVARAKDCYRLAMDATAAWRESALEDLRFLAGDQWDAQVKALRDNQGRPALTVNRLPQFVRQITNEQRQSKPSVTVSPVDSFGDVRTAEVLQGVIRNIEYTSNADAAYAAGGQSAAITGLGYWDIAAEYEDEKSFEQKLTIRRIRNPMSVLMDPGTKELAGDDARWAIISTDVSSAEWAALHPGVEMPKGNSGFVSGNGDAQADWVAKDGVRVHEYRYITEEEDTLVDISQLDETHLAALQLAGVDVSRGALLASEVGAQHAETLKALTTPDGKPAPTRKTTRRKVCFAHIAGDEVIERGELPGHYLQLVRVVGTELEIDGQTIYEGVIRHAKDTQRALNYYVSAETEAIALAPKAPWVAAEGQIEGYEATWERANQQPVSVLPYKPTTVAGALVPPPQRVMAEANIGAISTARMQTADDLKATTGIYDAALGAKSNEQSGRAILARQNQGQTANFHFQDNLGMAIRYTGRILIDLIPKIYAGPRVLRILGEDDKQEMVPVNGHQVEDGQEPPVDLNAGRYDVAVSMGPSYQSRRQEAAAQLLELIKVNPGISQVVGDLLVQSMDIPGGNAIADRLRKLLPPEVRPPDDKQPPPQVLAQQVQQQGQMIQQLTQAVHQAHNQLDSKATEAASRKEIALLQVQAELVKTAATLNSKEALAFLEHQMSFISQHLEMAAQQDTAPAPTPAPEEAANG